MQGLKPGIFNQSAHEAPAGPAPTITASAMSATADIFALQPRTGSKSVDKFSAVHAEDERP